MTELAILIFQVLMYVQEPSLLCCCHPEAEVMANVAICPLHGVYSLRALHQTERRPPQLGTSYRSLESFRATVRSTALIPSPRKHHNCVTKN